MSRSGVSAAVELWEPSDLVTSGRVPRILRQERDPLRLCGRFPLFTVLGFALICSARHVLVVPPSCHLFCMTEKSLRLLETHPSASEPAVTMSGLTVGIGSHCNAVYEVALYANDVWAYPAYRRDRILGTLVGAVVRYVIDVVRILTMRALGALQYSWFEAPHLNVRQVFFLLVVVTCWFGRVSRLRPVA